jgi:hypothetical protein
MHYLAGRRYIHADGHSGGEIIGKDLAVLMEILPLLFRIRERFQ